MGKRKKTKLDGFNKKKNIKSGGWSAKDYHSINKKYKWWKKYEAIE